jgi:membrane-associated phospholipid phosphatase
MASPRREAGGSTRHTSWRPWVILLVGLATSIVALAGFITIAAGVVEREVEAFDRSILSLIQKIRTPEGTRVMVALTALGDGVPLAAVTAFWVIASLARRDRPSAALMVFAAGGAAGLNLLLKPLFERSRPPDPLAAIPGGGMPTLGYAFPSGHAMLSLCIHGFAAYLALQGSPRSPARLTIAAAHALLILGIGFSRLYLGVHWPTDVAAGYLAGAPWLAACILTRALGCAWPRRTPRN